MTQEEREAWKRVERAVENLQRQLNRVTGGSTCRRVAKRTLRYALNPAEAIVDGIEGVVDLVLGD